MELLHLKYFKRAAELSSITKTAREFNVVQSAVSNHIKTLEDEIGAALFDRDKNYIILNANGKILYKYACRILNFVRDSKTEICDFNNQNNYNLTISIETVPIILPHIINGFKKKYPNIKLNLIQYQKNFNMSDMDCDVLIYASNHKVNEQNSITIYEEDVLLGVPKTHKLAKRKSVYLSELTNEKFIQRSALSEFKVLTDKYLEPLGFEPIVSIISDYPPFINELIASNMGIAFLPKLTWLYYNNPNIVLIKVKNVNIIQYINITWRKNCYISKAALLFIDYAKNFFSEL